MVADDGGDAAIDRIQRGEVPYDEAEDRDRIDLHVPRYRTDVGPQPGGEAVCWIDGRAEDAHIRAGLCEGQRFAVTAGGQVEGILLTASRDRPDARRPFRTGQVIQKRSIVVEAISGDRRSFTGDVPVEP